MCLFPRLNQEEIENMKKLTTSNETESVIYKRPTNSSSGPGDFTGEFYQPFKTELAPTLLKIFQTISEEGNLLNSFYKAITLMPKAKTPPKISYIIN